MRRALGDQSLIAGSDPCPCFCFAAKEPMGACKGIVRAHRLLMLMASSVLRGDVVGLSPFASHSVPSIASSDPSKPQRKRLAGLQQRVQKASAIDRHPGQGCQSVTSTRVFLSSNLYVSLLSHCGHVPGLKAARRSWGCCITRPEDLLPGPAVIRSS